MHRPFLPTLCLAFALAAMAPSVGAAYQITKVTRSGVDNLELWDINNAGLVVGNVATADFSVQTPFIYDSHTRVFTDLTGPTGAIYSDATGISDTGVVVGGYGTSTSIRSYIYEGGHYTDFSLPGSSSTSLRGISADGRYLTGIYDGNNGFVFDRDSASFVTIGASMIVKGINSHGIVAGSTVGADATPFLFDLASQTLTAYAPTGDRYRDINDDGIIAGWGFRDGFDYIVGIVGAPGSASVLNVRGSFGTFGFGINNDATIVGAYTRRDGTNAGFIATSVPEPGAWALLLAGGLGLAAARQRSQRRD